MTGARGRLAVASSDESGLTAAVGLHFGRAAAWTFVDVADGRIESIRIVPNPIGESHEPGDVPAFLARAQADVVLAGGIGRRALGFLEEHGIRVSSGHRGTAAGPASCGGGQHRHGGGHGCGRPHG